MSIDSLTLAYLFLKDPSHLPHPGILGDIYLILSLSVLIENYMHDRLSFSALFLGYDPHNHVYMPSNTTFQFKEGKACSILQEFSTELSEEPRLTSEKS